MNSFPSFLKKEQELKLRRREIEFSQLLNLKSQKIIQPEEYLFRLRDNSSFPETVYLYAAYLLIHVTQSGYGQVLRSTGCIKLFAACLNISQKLLQERTWPMENFSYLTGLSAKSISKIEIFLLQNIFQFKLTHSSECMNEFCKWILNLENWLSTKIPQKKNSTKQLIVEKQPEEEQKKLNFIRITGRKKTGLDHQTGNLSLILTTNSKELTLPKLNTRNNRSNRASKML